MSLLLLLFSPVLLVRGTGGADPASGDAADSPDRVARHAEEHPEDAPRFRNSLGMALALVPAGEFRMGWAAGHPAWAGLVFVPSLFVIGVGMGPTSLCLLLDVQNAVAWDRRGAATRPPHTNTTNAGRSGCSTY